MQSKYQELWKYLDQIFQTTKKDNITLSFEQIQGVLGFEIDHSFLNAKKELLEWGYQVQKIHMKEKMIHFSKVDH